MTTTTQQAIARQRGAQQHADACATRRGEPARTKAQALAECAAELQRVVTALYGAGAPIPPAHGGGLFREVASVLRERGYAVTEADLSRSACALGLWRDSVRSVVEAVRPGAPDVWDEEAEEAPGVTEGETPPEPRACCAGKERKRGVCHRRYSAWRRGLEREQKETR